MTPLDCGLQVQMDIRKVPSSLNQKAHQARAQILHPSEASPQDWGLRGEKGQPEAEQAMRLASECQRLALWTPTSLITRCL
jgi:hypothetical protein